MSSTNSSTILLSSTGSSRFGDGDVYDDSDVATVMTSDGIVENLPNEKTEEVEEATNERPNFTSITFTDGPTVEKIIEEAFKECDTVKTIFIPDTILEISRFAFSFCTTLETVTFSEKSQLTKIDEFAFNLCSCLRYITIPSSVGQISKASFLKCKNLEKVIFAKESQATTIGEKAFQDCSSLQSITIPPGIKNICKGTFARCTELENVTFQSESDLEEIGVCAFERCSSLQSISMPSNTTRILKGAFLRCTRLKEVAFPEKSNLTEIHDYAFQRCTALKSFAIPSKVKTIKKAAFIGCTELEEITFVKQSNLTEINEYAFRDCSSLASITIPSSIKMIYDAAFLRCIRLETVFFQENSHMEMIGEYAFQDCSSLKYFSVPSNVKRISKGAFLNCRSLENVTFSKESNLVTINQYSFCDCSSLETIVIPSSVTTIMKSAFIRCSGLEEVILHETSKLTEIGEFAFQDCSSLKSVIIPPRINKLMNSAFLNCSELKNVVFLEQSDLVEIGQYTFQRCSALTSITIPSCVKKILKSAFIGCTGLAKINFMELSKLESMGEYTFQLCSSLKSIRIPSGIEELPIGTFKQCKALEEVIFDKRSQLRKISAFAFQGCKKLRCIHLPSTVSTIEDYAFCDCSSLRHVTFADGSVLTGMKESIFRGCTSLEWIEIPTSVTAIGYDTFVDCKRLTTISFQNDKSDIRGVKSCLSANSTELLEGFIETRETIASFRLSELTDVEVDDVTNMILESKRMQKSLNSVLSSKCPTFIFFFDLYINIAVISMFLRLLITNAQWEEPNKIFLDTLLVIAGYFSMREFMKMITFGYRYINFWSVVDILKIVLVLTITLCMKWITNDSERTNWNISDLMILTVFVTILSLIFNLRSYIFSFARLFVGAKKIFSNLVPFLVISLPLLVGVDFIYYVKHIVSRANSNNEMENTSNFCPKMEFMETSTCSVLKSSNIDDYYQSLNFGALLPILLLNGIVLGAISEQWKQGGTEISFIFWKYRLYMLADPFPTLLSKLNSSCVPRQLKFICKRIYQIQNRSFFDNIAWHKHPFNILHEKFESRFELYRACLDENSCPLLDLSNYEENGEVFINCDSEEPFWIGNYDDSLADVLTKLRSWERDWYWVKKGKFRAIGTILLIVQYIIHCLCLVLGPFTFGLLWHQRIREDLFSHTFTQKSEQEDYKQIIHNLQENQIKMASSLKKLQKEYFQNNELLRDEVRKRSASLAELKNTHYRIFQDTLINVEGRVTNVEGKLFSLERKMDEIISILKEKTEE